LPRSRAQRFALLDAYVAQEESRPAEERFNIPALDDVRAVRDGLRASLEQREGGRTVRETGVALRDEMVEELLDLLQAAAVYLVVKRFGRRVTPELQGWGYNVVERVAAPAAEPAG